MVNEKKKKHDNNHEINLSESERIINNIILKHKEKLSNSSSSDKINIEKFSLKNHDGHTLYYLKKSSKKKSEKSEDLSDKIMAEARSNLGEEPINIDDKIRNVEQEIDETLEKKKTRKHIKFGKKPESIDQTTEIHDIENLVEDEDFNKVIDGIEKKSNIDIRNDTIEESKILDEKIKKEKEDIKEQTEPIIIGEEKAEQLIRKRGFFKNDNKQLKKENMDKPEKEKIKSPGLTSVPKDDTSDSNFLDKQISNYLKDEEKSAPEELPKTDKKIDEIKSEKTKPEFKKDSIKKPSIFKGFKSDKKLDEKTSKEKPGIPTVKPRFRVENLPDLNESEDRNLIDDNIKMDNFLKKPSEKENIGEEKAQKLAEKHLKEKTPDEPKPIFPEGKKQEDLEKFFDGKDDKKTEEEHVFFDEDASFEGWSPRIIEKDKKDMDLPIEGKSEIEGENLGQVSDIELPKDVLNIKSVKLSDLGFSEKEWEELDFYTLHDPFAYVEILRERETLDKCYFLVEIDLTDEEKGILDFIKETMNKVSIDTEEMDSAGDDDYLLSRIDQVIKEYEIELSEESLNKIIYYLGKSSLGLGRIDPLMRDPNIEDISCDGAGVPVFLYHRKYGSLKSNVNFKTEDELSSFVFRLAQKCGKHISIAEPMLDATMPDGSRIQMTLSDEITARGSTFTIRKFREDPFSPPDLIEFNTMSSEMVAYMWLAVENGINTLFAGGTASGKTTTLNAIALFIPSESKIVSIEETREINLPHPNWIPGVARSGFGEVVADKVVGEIDLYDLMKAALRQRPEYILVGEIRGREAYVLFQAMATGHATYSTVHADSAQSLIHRLEGKPINIPRVMLQSLDVVCLHVITRVKNKRARRCKQIIEIIDIDPTTKEILTNEVFRWDPVEDRFIYSGKSYILERVRAEKDLSREEITEELKNRTKIVEWMNKTNIREFRQVAQIVSRYLDSPAETMTQIKKDDKK
jgi:flagellar protein FlaI